MSNTKNGLVINATFRVEAEDKQKFIDIIRKNVAETVKKPGCNYYAFASDVSDDTLFHLVEGWLDRASLDAHLASPSFQATLAEVGGNVRVLARDAQLHTVSGQESI